MPTTTNNGWADWWGWALKAYQTYQNTKPGEFQTVPEDPGRVALRAQILGYMQNSPTRNMLGDMLKPRIAAANQNQFQLPQGARGYNPYPGGYQPAKYDLGKIFPNINSSDNPVSQAPPSPIAPTAGTPPVTGGAGGGGGFDGGGAITVEPEGGKHALPQVMRDPGGGLNSPSIKPYDDPTYTGLQPGGGPMAPGDPRGQMPADPNGISIDAVKSAIERFQEMTPNALDRGVAFVAAGVAALLGMPFRSVYGMVYRLMSGPQQPATPPTTPP